MPLPNVFAKEVSDGLIDRINNLTPESQRQWGKMDVSKMLAHCCVTYEMIYEPGKHPKPNPLMGLILKLFVKRTVTSDKPFKKNNPTAPQFIMKTDKNFDAEKARLIEYVQKTQALGADKFDGKASD